MIYVATAHEGESNWLQKIPQNLQQAITTNSPGK